MSTSFSFRSFGKEKKILTNNHKNSQARSQNQFRQITYIKQIQIQTESYGIFHCACVLLCRFSTLNFRFFKGRGVFLFSFLGSSSPIGLPFKFEQQANFLWLINRTKYTVSIWNFWMAVKWRDKVSSEEKTETPSNYQKNVYWINIVLLIMTVCRTLFL